VTEAGSGSDTINEILYTPVYAIDVEATPIMNGEGTVNIPLGIFTAAPPFRE
jgi:hypothetical protein